MTQGGICALLQELTPICNPGICCYDCANLNSRALPLIWGIKLSNHCLATFEPKSLIHSNTKRLLGMNESEAPGGRRQLGARGFLSRGQEASSSSKMMQQQHTDAERLFNP
eukprot:1136169-Pelagomonas_calceolata.AAC.3